MATLFASMALILAAFAVIVVHALSDRLRNYEARLSALEKGE